MVVPDDKLVMGIPAAVIRDTNDNERHYLGRVVENYLKLNRLHAAGRFPNVASSR